MPVNIVHPPMRLVLENTFTVVCFVIVVTKKDLKFEQYPCMEILAVHTHCGCMCAHACPKCLPNVCVLLS